MSRDEGFFTGAAASYHRARARLPDALARRLADETRAGRGPEAARLLDLGTGTGLMVEAMLPLGFDDVVAVDPDADMLAVAEQNLARQEREGPPVRLLHARAEDAALPGGWRPDLVTAGRSFHWTDQPVVARRVHALLPPGGVFALLGDGGPWDSPTPWKIAMRETIQAFLGAERRAGRTIVRPGGLAWTALLAGIGFRDVTEHDVPAAEALPLDAVVGYAHSFSFAAPPLLGDRLGAFDAALAEAVAPYADGGVLRDELTWSVLLARR